MLLATAMGPFGAPLPPRTRTAGRSSRGTRSGWIPHRRALACPSESEFRPRPRRGERSRHRLSALGHFEHELASAFAGDEPGECCAGIAEWVHVVDPRRDDALDDEGGHRLELGS